MSDTETRSQYTRMADAYDKLADEHGDAARNILGK